MEHCAASRVEVEPAVQLKATCKNSCPTIPATMARPAHAPKQLTQHEHKMSIVTTFGNILNNTSFQQHPLFTPCVVSVSWYRLEGVDLKNVRMTLWTVDPQLLICCKDSTKKHIHTNHPRTALQATFGLGWGPMSAIGFFTSFRLVKTDDLQAKESGQWAPSTLGLQATGVGNQKYPPGVKK